MARIIDFGVPEPRTSSPPISSSLSSTICKCVRGMFFLCQKPRRCRGYCFSDFKSLIRKGIHLGGKGRFYIRSYSSIHGLYLHARADHLNNVGAAHVCVEGWQHRDAGNDLQEKFNNHRSCPVLNRELTIFAQQSNTYVQQSDTGSTARAQFNFVLPREI